MSDPRSKRYTLEQCACMVEQYFWTSSYKSALGRFKKKFKEMPDPKTITRMFCSGWIFYSMIFKIIVNLFQKLIK